MRRLLKDYNGPPAAWVKIVRRICRCCRKSKKMPTTRYCWPDGTALCDDCFRRDGPPEEFFSAADDERLAAAAGEQPFNSSPRKGRSRHSNDRIPDFRAVQADEPQTGHPDYWSI